MYAALVNYGFKGCSTDYSLFSLQQESIHLVVLVYVDDLIVTGNDPATIRRFQAYLSQCFHMKDLGKLKYFLGVEVMRSPIGIFLSQHKYALDIVQEAGLLGAKPARTPMEENRRLAFASGPLLSNPSSYRRIVGCLIYLCFT